MAVEKPLKLDSSGRLEETSPITVSDGTSNFQERLTATGTDGYLHPSLSPPTERNQDGIVHLQTQIDGVRSVLERGVSISPTIAGTVTVENNAIWLIL